MSTLIIILISAGALILGVGVGYYLRVIVALGKRRSIEIDIKQMMVCAKEGSAKNHGRNEKSFGKKLAELKEEEKRKNRSGKKKNQGLSKRRVFGRASG